MSEKAKTLPGKFPPRYWAQDRSRYALLRDIIRPAKRLQEALKILRAHASGLPFGAKQRTLTSPYGDLNLQAWPLRKALQVYSAYAGSNRLQCLVAVMTWKLPKK
jgi:hypothetical protein